MTNENYDQQTKKWTACERWHFTGHSLLAVGTLCISVANLLQLANTGKISEFGGYQPSSTKFNSPQMSSGHNDGSHPMDYFRRG
jgi:hypothetical protein